MTLIVLVALWCVVLCVWLWIRPRHPEPPTYPGSLPIIGHAHIAALLDPVKLWEFEQMVHQYSLDRDGITKFILGPVSLYVLSDPDDCLYVSNVCIDKPYVYECPKRMYNRGLITADTQTWKAHRSLFNPAFNQQVINSLFDVFCREAEQMIFELGSQVGKPFDIQPHLTRNIMRIGFGTVFGVDDLDSNETTDKYASATHDMFLLYFKRMRKIWLHLPIIYNMSSLKKEEDILISTLQEISNEVIKNRKLEFKNKCLHNTEERVKRRPLIDIMFELAEEKNAFTDDEVREHLNTFMAAVYDTSLCATTYILLLIASYPEVQEKLYKELQEVFGGENRDLSRLDLPKLVYLEAVIKEVLRLFPPVPKIARVTKTTLKLRDYIIPAGSICIMSLYGINRHPMWGPDANEFKPERWLNPSTLPANRHAFASFSLGKRNCIGKTYAMMALKITISHLVQKFKITGDIHKVKSRCDVVLKPISGHHISLELRK